MNKLIVLIFVLVGMITVSMSTAEAFETCQTGSWYEPETGGQGLSVEIHHSVIVVYFYHYHDTKKEWHIFVGTRPYDGSPAALTAYEVIQLSKSPWVVVEEPVGNAGLTDNGDGTLTFDYRFDLDLDEIDEGVALPLCASDDCSGSLTVTALTQPFPCD